MPDLMLNDVSLINLRVYITLLSQIDQRQVFTFLTMPYNNLESLRYIYIDIVKTMVVRASKINNIQTEN